MTRHRHSHTSSSLSSSTSASAPHHSQSGGRPPDHPASASQRPDAAGTSHQPQTALSLHTRGEAKADHLTGHLSLSRLCNRLCVRLKTFFLSFVPPILTPASQSSLPPSSASSPPITPSLGSSAPQLSGPSSHGVPVSHATSPNSLPSQREPCENRPTVTDIPRSSRATRVSYLSQLDSLRRDSQSQPSRNSPASYGLHLETVSAARLQFIGLHPEPISGPCNAFYSGFPRKRERRITPEITPGLKMADDIEAANGLRRNGHDEQMDLVGGLSHDDSQDADMADSLITATPTQPDAPTPLTAGSAFSSRPITRSMTKALFGQSHATSSTGISFRERLSESSGKAATRLHSSNLEDSRDITYEDAEQENGDHDEVESEVGNQGLSLVSQGLEEPKRIHPATGQLRVPTRQSACINDPKLVSRDSTPSSSMTLTSGRPRKKGKKGQAKTDFLGRYVRRSARLAKPLVEFHKFPELPPELQIMVWEFAVEPRAVYICNRSSLAHSGIPFGVQNRFPSWFMTCNLSAWVALSQYQRLFSLQGPMPTVGRRTSQSVNPTVDIVIFEPCHSGCRGYHCARHQYDDESRSAVRFLAVQTESPNLVPATEPCWQSLTRSWPNIETLYLMRVAVKGISRQDKAIIRVKTNDHEKTLLERFEQWKKGPGMHMKISKLEFVMVTEKDTTATVDSRYRNIIDRATGLPEDIILG